MVGLRFVVVRPTVILRAPLASIVFAIPDLGYTLVIAGSVALGWRVLRTVLTLRLAPRGVTAAGRAALLHT